MSTFSIICRRSISSSLKFDRKFSLSSKIDKSKIIRDACSIVVVRDCQTNPKVLMGQRGSGAAFMPNKFVFPGGGVDLNDAFVPCVGELSSLCNERLTKESKLGSKALALTAIRELWEETGQIIGIKRDSSIHMSNLTDVNKKQLAKDWESFFDHGYIPNISDMSFIFRAVTPEGRPRRFDARFFFIEAENLATDLDNFSKSDNELKHLQWIPLDEVTGYDLPFITKVVLAEIKHNITQDKIHNIKSPPFLPFFRDGDDVMKFSTVLHTGAQDLSEFQL